MSGRAGRRGKDDRGIVIMMMDSKMEVGGVCAPMHAPASHRRSCAVGWTGRATDRLTTPTINPPTHSTPADGVQVHPVRGPRQALLLLPRLVQHAAQHAPRPGMCAVATQKQKRACLLTFLCMNVYKQPPFGLGFGQPLLMVARA